jgi:hypothetical protein
MKSVNLSLGLLLTMHFLQDWQKIELVEDYFGPESEELKEFKQDLKDRKNSRVEKEFPN